MAIRNEEQQKYYDMIYRCIDDLDSSSLVYLHNEYCEKNCYDEDIIYLMAGVDEVLGGVFTKQNNLDVYR